MLAFSKQLCYYIQALRKRKQNPGVAKFGIALEWGSRGLEFESRHSDQRSRNNICCFCFFISMLQSNSRPLVSQYGRRQSAHSARLPRVRISTLGPKKQKQHLLFLLFYFNVAIELEASCITIWPEAVGAQRPTASSSNLDTRTISLWNHGYNDSVGIFLYL